MTFKPGDRVWVEWPRHHGDRGLVADLPRGRSGHRVWRLQDGLLNEVTNEVWRVRVDPETREATLDCGRGAQRRRVRCRAGELGENTFTGEVTDVVDVV